MKFINTIFKVVSIISTIILTSMIVISIIDDILIWLYKLNNEPWSAYWKRKDKKYNDENYLFKKRKYTTVKRREEDIDYNI